MKIIKSSTDVIHELNPFKKVEIVGRTCYKSEDSITEDSCYKFVQNLINRDHFAMLEHGHVVFKLNGISSVPTCLRAMPGVLYSPDVYLNIVEGEEVCCYVGMNLSHLYNPIYSDVPDIHKFRQAVTNKYLPDDISINCTYDTYTSAIPGLEDVNIEIIEDIESDEVKDVAKFTVKFLCDRGVSHELVRHRCSAAQESTRYCNYTKSKFGGEILFIEPTNFEYWEDQCKEIFIEECMHSEAGYISMIALGKTPQQARAILPNSLKTECILTMGLHQWNHFFNLRSRGTTGAPHPDMKVVADDALTKLSDKYTKLAQQF